MIGFLVRAARALACGAALAAIGPFSAFAQSDWTKEQQGAYQPRPGSSVTGYLGRPTFQIQDVACEDNNVRGPLNSEGVPSNPFLKSPPLYLAGIYVHEGAWLEMITTACNVAETWGAWDKRYSPELDRYFTNGYGVADQRWQENTHYIGQTTEAEFGGSFAAERCSTDYFVQGFDLIFAKEKQAVARVQLTCVNPRTGATEHVVPGAGMGLPTNTGLTYQQTPSVSCPHGSLAVGFVGWLTDWSMPSVVSRIAGDKMIQPAVGALSLICRPFTPHGVPLATQKPGDLSRFQGLPPSQYIGTFGANAGQWIWLYTVEPDGKLNEHILPPGATSWQGPIPVGSGWGKFAEVLPGLGDQVFGRASDGYLQWYAHDGFQDGAVRWRGPLQVGAGYQEARFFSGGDNIIYAVNASGDLVWRRLTDIQAKRGDENFFTGQHRIAPGFGQYVKLFSMGAGVIYGVTADGRLMWYRHAGYLDGSPGVEGPIQVGTDWNQFRDILPVGDGVILAIKPDGAMLRYRHIRYADMRTPVVSSRPLPRRDAAAWEGPTPLGSGWTGYSKVFALLPQAQSTGSVVH